MDSQSDRKMQPWATLTVGKEANERRSVSSMVTGTCMGGSAAQRVKAPTKEIVMKSISNGNNLVLGFSDGPRDETSAHVTGP